MAEVEGQPFIMLLKKMVITNIVTRSKKTGLMKVVAKVMSVRSREEK